MADKMTPQQRHYCMSRIHSSSTKPEVKLRHRLWHLGFRYRLNYNKLPGRPDIVLPRYRTVVFVNGCFWHGHKGCPSYVVPKTNTGFWIKKIERNRERDQEMWRRLEALGWKVVVVWECQLKKAEFEATVLGVKNEIVSGGKEYRERIALARQLREKSRKEQAERKARDEYFRLQIKERYNR